MTMPNRYRQQLPDRLVDAVDDYLEARPPRPSETSSRWKRTAGAYATTVKYFRIWKFEAARRLAQSANPETPADHLQRAIYVEAARATGRLEEFG